MNEQPRPAVAVEFDKVLDYFLLQIIREGKVDAYEQDGTLVTLTSAEEVYTFLRRTQKLQQPLLKSLRDAELESLWEAFGDAPMNPETECMEAEFIGFPAGTHREEIWEWFDERHSKGVAFLMNGKEATP